MSETPFPFQPGVILYDVILGLLRAQGVTFDKWCAANDVAPSSARNALYGQSKRKSGKALLGRMVQSAGPEAVQQTYVVRVKQHSELLQNLVGGEA